MSYPRGTKRVEKGIYYISSKKCYMARYQRRSKNNSMRPISIQRYGFKTLKEARVERERMMVEINEKIKQARDPLWKELLDEVIKEMYEEDFRYSKKTVHNYETSLKGNTISNWGNVRVSKISTGDIKKFFRVNKDNWSNGHIKSMVKMLNKVFEYAIENDFLNRNPMPKFSIKSHNKLKTVLNENQLRLLLMKAKELDSPWYPIWATAIYTGMRSGEMYALKWENVCLKQKQVKVVEAWNSKDGFKSTKSGHDRMVEIAEPLLVVFKELKLKTYESGFVLPRMDKWKKGEQARYLRMFLTGVGLPEVRFHDLRASWATLMMSKGVEPIKVMKMGGWQELKTMERYVRQAGVDIKGITNCLNEIHDPSFNGGEVLGIFSHEKSGEKEVTFFGTQSVHP